MVTHFNHADERFSKAMRILADHREFRIRVQKALWELHTLVQSELPAELQAGWKALSDPLKDAEGTWEEAFKQMTDSQVKRIANSIISLQEKFLPIAAAGREV